MKQVSVLLVLHEEEFSSTSKMKNTLKIVHESTRQEKQHVVCERRSCCRAKQQHRWQTRFVPDVPTSLGHLQPDGNICAQNNNERQQIPATQSAALSVCSSSITDQPLMIMYNSEFAVTAWEALTPWSGRPAGLTRESCTIMWHDVLF